MATVLFIVKATIPRKKEAAFNARMGESRADYLPKPGDPKAAAWSRFIALELVLADLLGMSQTAVHAHGLSAFGRFRTALGAGDWRDAR